MKFSSFLVLAVVAASPAAQANGRRKARFSVEREGSLRTNILRHDSRRGPGVVGFQLLYDGMPRKSDVGETKLPIERELPHLNLRKTRDGRSNPLVMEIKRAVRDAADSSGYRDAMVGVGAHLVNRYGTIDDIPKDLVLYAHTVTKKTTEVFQQNHGFEIVHGPQQTGQKDHYVLAASGRDLARRYFKGIYRLWNSDPKATLVVRSGQGREARVHDHLGKTHRPSDVSKSFRLVKKVYDRWYGGRRSDVQQLIEREEANWDWTRVVAFPVVKLGDGPSKVIATHQQDTHRVFRGPAATQLADADLMGNIGIYNKHSRGSRPALTIAHGGPTVTNVVWTSTHRILVSDMQGSITAYKLGRRRAKVLKRAQIKGNVIDIHHNPKTGHVAAWVWLEGTVSKIQLLVFDKNLQQVCKIPTETNQAYELKPAQIWLRLDAILKARGSRDSIGAALTRLD